MKQDDYFFESFLTTFEASIILWHLGQYWKLAQTKPKHHNLA